MREKLLVAASVVIAVGLIAWGAGLFDALGQWLLSLSGRPEVRDAFTDPGYGRVDAFILLLSVFVLSPFGAVLVVAALTIVLILAGLLFEPILRTLHMPEWAAVPVVLAGSACWAWVASPLWLPQSLQVLGLVVRAWTVYFGSASPIPR